MAEAGLFVGWGAPIRGRELKGLDVFNEALAFYGGQQESGGIESFEVVLIGPHGGDLAGFILVRGSQEQIGALRRNEDFQRINIRANQVVERLGVVESILQDGLQDAINQYRDAVTELS